ncbi:MAG: cyclic nucleotide-binding domain-containing protein [Spirochaetales bacterium]|nr:cyclic nucleotide-binding domain-containing protein [Spirochaetales bacterium]
MSVRLELVDKLKKIPFLKDIRENDDYMTRLLSIIKIRKYPEGRYVIQEGEIGSELFIVYKGGVEIRKKTRAGDDYTVVVLKAKDNAFFGEMGLIDDDKRSATVLTLENSIFMVISKEDFIALGNQFPDIGLPITRAISKILAGRLRKTTQDMLTIFDALVNEIRG